MWNRQKEVKRIKERMEQCDPMSQEYADLLAQRLLLDDALKKELDNEQLIPGVSNETLAAGAATAGATLFVGKFLTKNFIGKELLTPLLKMLPSIKIRR